MKKTKGTGVMLFGMFAIIVIIAVFILAGNGAKKEAASKEIRVGLLLYRGMIPYQHPASLYRKKRRKEYERTEGIKVTLDILECKKQPEYPEQPGGPAAGVRMQCLVCEYRRSLCSFCCH